MTQMMEWTRASVYSYVGSSLQMGMRTKVQMGIKGSPHSKGQALCPGVELFQKSGILHVFAKTLIALEQP